MTDKPVSILVVDDDETKRYPIVRLLKKQGFQVTEADTGADALAAARSGPDLVVLDVRLPDMSGFEVCRRLKAEHATSGILVLHMSATLVDSEHRAEGLNAGADAYLTDAVNAEEFLATVRALLRARNAERALRESEKRFEFLVRSVEEYAIYTCDAFGTITSWNEGVQRIFGYRAEQFVNRPYAISFASKEEALNDLAAARQDGQIEYDGWHERGDGSRFFATGVLKAIEKEGGEVIGFVNIVRDITLRRQAEDERAELLEAEHRARQQAERANRLKDEFLATLSHELRTPLSAILGWTQLLKTGKLDPAEVREGIDVIDRNARAQSQLIEDLLDVTRIISGKLRLSIERIELPSLVTAAIESMQAAAHAKRIRVAVFSEADAGTITGDPSRVQQILWNLLSNAVKFTPERGEIAIRLYRLAREVEISVTDNGPGIDPQFLPYVFDRFRQADATTTRTQSGLGLCLAIVRYLTELHGGTVSAESEGKGRGATFRVCLPVAMDQPAEVEVRETAPRQARPQSDAEPPDLTGMKLLVVEDDSDTRTLLKKVLEQCGAKVQAVGSSAEGILAFSRERPDLIISDIAMPGEDGYVCIRKIRDIEAGSLQPIPAIALTAFAQPEDRRRALRSGFQVHVPKPVEPAELLGVVGSFLSRTGATVE